MSVAPEPAVDARPRFWRDVIKPGLLFSIVYLIIVIAGVLITFSLIPEEWLHVIALAAAIVATLVANRVFDGGHWRIGFTGGPSIALRETALGLLAAILIIGLADALIILTTGFEHRPGKGVDWALIVLLFLPAALHEEVLMRGYAFQKFAAWNRGTAVIVCSLAFALLHAGNLALSALAVLNLFLAGVLLSVAYLVFQRLWLPVGLHFFWNVFTGPVLGHEVSGLRLGKSVFAESDPGPAMLTGGAFGLEGSIWATVVEGIAIAILLIPASRRQWRAPIAASPAPEPPSPPLDPTI